MTTLDEAVEALPSPCLLVDLGAVQANMAHAADLLAGSGIVLRPHYKAHKCSRLLRLQLEAAGGRGVTCQTSWEAAALARAGGFDDVLVANQVVDRHAVDELADAAGATRVTVAVDRRAHIELLAAAAARRGVAFEVLVEIDVGMGRSGLPPGDPELLDLVGMIGSSPGLRFRGLQAYEGHAVLRQERATRAELVGRAATWIRQEVDRLAAAGVICELRSGGGTGTMDLAPTAGALDEVQAGSYVLLDATYDRLDLGFVPALTCVTTVISRRDRRAVLNAGLKELSAEYGVPAVLPGGPAGEGATVASLADEHAPLDLAPGSTLAVGDQVRLVPGHVDPTVNLHDVLFVWDGHGMEAWPVDGRRSLGAHVSAP